MVMRWSLQSEQLADRRGIQFAARLGSRQATYAEVLHAWRDDAPFRSAFNASLAEVPFVALRWETPPVTAMTVSRPFEFVVLDCPGLARRPDPEAFAPDFGRKPEESVVAFPNLGGDAIMIVPRPIAAISCYGHLASFVREAPEAQRHALWQVVGESMSSRLCSKPVWLSTAGAGVSWLHVRLDDRPKYYNFEPYRRP